MNRVCEILGIEKPVIQGAMVWITDARMVAAVSNAGGAGVIGINAGAKDWDNPPLPSAERLRHEIRKTRELTDKPFGVNMGVYPEVDRYAAETLEVFETDRPDFVVIIPFNPASPEVIGRLKELGIKIVSRPMTASPENMLAAEADGADILICTGSEEGGSAPENRVSLVSRFPSIREVVKAPLMAAGGIVDRASAECAKAMGAEGIYAGTRFMVTPECPMAESVKQAIIDARADDMVTIPTPGGCNHLVGTPFAKELDRLAKSGMSPEDLLSYFEPPTSYRNGMLLGDPVKSYINTNEAIDGITSMMTCAEVVDELNVF